MTASQREPQPQQRSQPRTPERTTAQARTSAQARTPAGAHGAAEPSDVPMSDLLASCAAASAVSTPPADGSDDQPEPRGPRANSTGERGRAVATR
ncbi:hypothetical protein [Streptomyces montanisoli]|uniref:Uncharacterized protein n=1 Tax=Streptomyces montanisoli TaxID=2798581 RepID=A0A940MDV9_9ACTN|nr:hypothetical protein [Streptomyces montanisoli]MBP0461160.1 hypothetical protein [Streptomyces montanisoli]